MGDTATAPDTERGVYQKYRVERLNDPEGKHDDCPYFVLDIKHDPHARTAVEAYALSCEDEYPKLAADLRAGVTRADAISSGSSGRKVSLPVRRKYLVDLVVEHVRKALARS